MDKPPVGDGFIDACNRLFIYPKEEVMVLGTRYTITYTTEDNDPDLKGLDGYCDTASKQIVIETDRFKVNNPKAAMHDIMLTARHEIVHAFFAECGLGDMCSYACSEELVDWIAMMIPKLSGAMVDADVMKIDF